MAVILHVTIVPAGAGSVQLSPMGDYQSPGRVSYPGGTSVTLTAFTAISGAYFDHWEGDVSGTNNPTTIRMDSDKEVIAVFGILEEIPTYQLTTAVIGNGRVDPSSGVFGEGDQTILVATPDEGNLFDYWSGDIGGTSPVPGMPNNLQVTMDRDRHIIAHFVEEVAPPPPPPPEEVYYVVDIEINPPGAGYVTKTPHQNTYLSGIWVVLKAYPNPGYQFSQWRGDASGTSPEISILMDRDKWVEALFAEVPPPPLPAEPEFRGFAVSEYTKR